ncbi:hypothetical protein LEP1GSC020_3400 [Leptospira interrogans serovar Grippotyphosa str. 2006006986]|nr:hypothetical protein LEP1GSC009_0714 [Leptospira interrogans serovar Grippotyphosa str. Andaman]EKP83489.1 hypothetical protein LEP1GSC020_3400 [Leptospira interrogans serovar Grippotyphosa str. 2006006986]EMJ54310.1 hypothetical protein LEP1GSC111_1103 [Leptospira interrogans str. UT126]EMN53675.1 hypothetical protein LEP1GSC089_2688 [Leptospira interrogans serovar Autumnalis str. LP101]EMN69159.1 hypothetical protein LEP1GSC098_0985 [Leptospira interrogans serovar Grippotyphosa str. UI 084
MRKRGITIPQNDLWIAALIAQYNIKLCTTDKHFENIEFLNIEKIDND